MAPHVDNPDAGVDAEEVPGTDKPHLLLGTRVIGGQITGVAIPEGATLVLVMDPKDINKGAIPLILRSVNKRKWVFQCKCGKRRFVLEGKWVGPLRGCCEYTQR